jgi:type III restriction enzyme
VGADTWSGRIVMLETKDDDRNNSDSVRKLKLSRAWEKEAGRDFLYCMVFDKNQIGGAYRLADAIRFLRNI